MIQIPLSQSGPLAPFAAAVEAHRAALAAHRIGPPGIAAPAAHPLIESLITAVPQPSGPDSFVVLPYEIVDDTPKPPEVTAALAVLRESMA